MDLVATVPKRAWIDWLAEGDLAGHRYGTPHPQIANPGSKLEWLFFLGKIKPPIKPGERLYIVSWGLIRGYAPVVRVEQTRDGRWAIVRHHGAVAVTIDESVTGFQGFRKRWWDYHEEQPFPDWPWRGVGMPERDRQLLKSWYQERLL